MTQRSDLPIADDVASPNKSDRQRFAELESRLRETEDALRLSNGQLRTALDVGKLGSWDCDLRTGLISGTATFKASLGLPKDAPLTYEQWQQMVHSDDAERVRQAISSSVSTGTDFNIEHRILRGDGRVGRVFVRGSAIRDGDGKPARLIGVTQDLSEEEPHETDPRLRAIAGSLSALVWIVDLNLGLTYVNDRWVAFSGLQRPEALGDSWGRWVHPDDLPRFLDGLNAARRNESPYATEMRYRSAAGIYRWHMVQAAPMRDPDGNLTGWVGTSVDIHDLKVAEEALRTDERQLRTALQAAKMGDWTWDAASDRMTLSPRAAEIFGLPPEASRTWLELTEQLHPADAARAVAAMQKAAETQTEYNLEYRVTRADDGARVWVAAQGRTVHDREGTFTGMTGVVQDITDRKHAEQRQHLLIRELHHRVKNTLATVQAIVGSTARTASSIDEFYQGFVGRIVSLARTHNLLTEDLWQKAALEELIQTELGPYEDEARNRIVVDGPHVELPSEAAVPIGMAIHELTTNAAKHGALSTFGGQVDVKWHIEPGAERPLLHFTWTEHGGPRVTQPSRQGFGSRLLQRVLTTQLQAQVHMDFQEEGLRFSMTMPMPGDPPLFNPDK
ncbi:MAG TPA: PAS domain-containing protein [Microvirga sp.]|jgi:PAS domain S-box-containing protein|nr:PAS domain-containing protein [Microvirga sp.]